MKYRPSREREDGARKAKTTLAARPGAIADSCRARTKMAIERVTTGVPGLDQLIEGGIPKGRSVLVTGEPGTGKSIFSLQFLAEGLTRGEKVVYVAADEQPFDVVEQAVSMGWDFEQYVENKQLAILNAGTYLTSLTWIRQRPSPRHSQGDQRSRYIREPARGKAPRAGSGGSVPAIRDSATRIQDQTRLLMKLLRTTMQTTNILTSYAVPRTGERTMHGVEEYLVAGAIVSK